MYFTLSKRWYKVHRQSERQLSIFPDKSYHQGIWRQRVWKKLALCHPCAPGVINLSVTGEPFMILGVAFIAVNFMFV
jgi:hypothetical protein